MRGEFLNLLSLARLFQICLASGVRILLLIELSSSATRLIGFAMHILRTGPARAKALAIEQPSAPPLTGLESKRKRPSSRTRRRSRAQALTEYSTLIAFVSVLIALAFSFTEGKVAPAVSKAFHETAKQLDALSSAATSSS